MRCARQREAQKAASLISSPTAEYLPPKVQPGLPAMSALNPLAPPVEPEFNVATYVEDVARRAGLPVDSPQVGQAITILRTNGFVSRKTLDSLTEKIALDYLKLPIVVWVCLSQTKKPEEAPRSTGNKRTCTAAEDIDRADGEPTKHKDDPPAKKLKRESEDAPSATTVAERIARYCHEVGHDPAFFQVKSVNLVNCLVCNKTFKLHGRGQITRVKRHIRGEGKKGMSRHMHNLLSVKEKLRTQQLPMLWQIPAHILQQVQQRQIASALPSTPPTTPVGGVSAGGHLLANILPAVSSRSSPSLSPSPSSLSALSLGLGSPSHTAGLSAQQPFLSTPLFSQAMAAVPSLQMLQSPQQEALDRQGQPPVSPSNLSTTIERKRLDSETGLVHCHCLTPAKPVLVRDQPASMASEDEEDEGGEEDDSQDSHGEDDDEADGCQQPEGSAAMKRFYVCNRRQSDDGCTFVRPNDFVTMRPGEGLEVLDIQDETLQAYVDQGLVAEGDEDRDEDGVIKRNPDTNKEMGRYMDSEILCEYHQIADAGVGSEVAGEEEEMQPREEGEEGEEVLVEPIPEQVVKDVSEALSEEGHVDRRGRGREVDDDDDDDAAMRSELVMDDDDEDDDGVSRRTLDVELNEGGSEGLS